MLFTLQTKVVNYFGVYNIFVFYHSANYVKGQNKLSFSLAKSKYGSFYNVCEIRYFAKLCLFNVQHLKLHY